MRREQQRLNWTNFDSIFNLSFFPCEFCFCSSLCLFRSFFPSFLSTGRRSILRCVRQRFNLHDYSCRRALSASCSVMLTEAAKTTYSRKSLLSWLVGCLTSQQHASVSQGRTCSDNCTCCHTEIEVAGKTFHLTQSQYTDTGPTSPSADPITPGAWQGSHWSAIF